MREFVKQECTLGKTECKALSGGPGVPAADFIL
jgi:hypothetical protein